MNQIDEKPDWEGKKYAFFCHKECEAFPCHAGIAEDQFNCLFCYCPLYALGDRCGGAFTYTETGIKDCSKCEFPHRKKNYGVMMERFSEIVKLSARSSQEKE